MKHLQNLRIARRLALANLFSVSVLVAAAGVGSFSIRFLHATAQHAVDFDVQVAQRAAQIKAGVLEERRFEKDVFINLADAEKVDSYEAKWIAQRNALLDGIRQFGDMPLAEEDRQVLADIGTAFSAYTSGFEGVVKMIRAKQIKTTQDANVEMTKYKDAVHKMEAVSAALNERAIARVGGIDRTITASRDRAIAMLSLFAVGGTVLSFALGRWIGRSITHPVEEAVRFAKTVATGDLTASIEAARGDEIGELLQALRSMNESLVRIVQRVRDGAEHVAGASSQIASANGDLSARTAHQASNLEETAAAMEQLTSTVAQTGSNAKLANELVCSTSEVAAKGGQIVEEIVAKMEGITTASKRIAEIIGVVDSIAFQTNILALNAAVEAARAGEQGRGFAVVASEVRTLAQRSAQAAREIRDMILDSVQRVDEGSRLVSEAGASMAGIVTQIRRVADLIGEVSSAVTQQSSGIGEINTAVSQMDAFTQQNSALVEQSAAASTSLSEQARLLTEAVATFRLVGQGHAPARAGALEAAA